MALINCQECGSEISDTAVTCPHCGCKNVKEEAKAPFSEFFCFFSLIIACALCFLGLEGMFIGYIITLFWLAVYENKCNKYKKMGTVDYSKIKKTRNTILIFFVLQFGIVIVF